MTFASGIAIPASNLPGGESDHGNSGQMRIEPSREREFKARYGGNLNELDGVVFYTVYTV